MSWINHFSNSKLHLLILRFKQFSFHLNFEVWKLNRKQKSKWHMNKRSISGISQYKPKYLKLKRSYLKRVPYCNAFISSVNVEIFTKVCLIGLFHFFFTTVHKPKFNRHFALSELRAEELSWELFWSWLTAGAGVLLSRNRGLNLAIKGKTLVSNGMYKPQNS